MNILELDSYNLADAVKFNDRLNPKLWTADEHLRPEVNERLLAIADDFREFLGVKDLDLKDITLSGSNAAYTYTPNSDIDLHLVVDMPDDEVYRELFDAKKFQYNEQHNIKIGDYDVELYVQDAAQPHISQGIYSILNNKWIQVPRRIKSVVDDTSTRTKFETIGNKIERAIKSGNLKQITLLIEKIKKMRQTGLENHGEFGPENLAFKMLRTQGKIKELYDARNGAKDRELSLKEKAIKPQKITYGFKTPTVVEDVGMSWDGVSPDTKMFLSETESDEEILQDFIEFCVKELKIEKMPTIKLRRDPQWPVVHRTFGRYINDKHTLEVAFGQRHIMDVLRTVAHELTHKHQHERDGAKMDATAGETGSPWENEANARAGVLMRDYGRMHPELFADGVIDIDEGYGASTPAGEKIVKWQQDKIAGKEFAIQGYRIKFTDKGLLIFKGADLVFKKPGDYSNPTNLDMTKARRYVTNLSNNWNPGPVVNEATGYIPTAAQAHDPRFEMALTQDVRPGALGKAANAFLLNTDSQGHPQVANPNGLFEKLALELSQFKKKNKLEESTEQLDEVKMSPTALQRWAKSPEAAGIRAGFEAELIFRDTASGDDSDYEMEPDYDADERCRSIQQIIDFFNNGEYGGLTPRQESRLQDGLDEQYFEWQDEQMRQAFQDEQDELVRDVWLEEKPWGERLHAALVDGLDVSDKEADKIAELGEARKNGKGKPGNEYTEEELDMLAKYSEAAGIANDVLDEDVEQSIAKQDGYYDSALEEFRDGFYVDDDSGFFDDIGLRWMSDVANEYDLDWPYMTGGGGNDGSRSWEEIGDDLHGVVDMPVKVSSNYHSTTRKEGMWIVEPDSSLEPDDREDFGLEIVSPPLPLEQALEKLQEVTDWANGDGNAYTNSSTGLHMGVSVPFKGGDVDYLKLILFLGDEYVLQQFGREANTYCKSAMSKFRENIKGGRADPMSVIKLMQHGLLELAHKEIQKGVGEGKYTSAHIQKGYIEFRSAGGDWLAEANAMLGEAAGIGSTNKLQNTMLRYARAMSLAANPAEERREYAKKLYKLVAPEGDSELALFSQYAAGELTAEQLKKRWAEKTIGTEKKMNQRWRLYQKVDGVWEPVPGAEWNGYPESEVKNKVWSKYGREALDTGEYQLVNMGEQDWEVYDVNTGKTLEIVKGKSKGEVADQVYDKYVDQGIGFQVRPYVDPATLTPRAKLAKRIAEPKEKGDWDVIYKPTGRVIDNILRVDREQAEKLLKQVAVLHDFENADNLEIRPQDLTKAADNTEPGDWEFYRTETGNVIDRVSNASKMQANAVRADIVRRYGHPDTSVGMRRVDQVQDVEPDVAQNFAQPQNATDRVGSWAIYDVTLGREISRMDNVPWQQASDRADMLERSTGHNMSVRGLSENIDPVSGRGAVAPTMPSRLKPEPKVKSVSPAVRVDINNHRDDPYADTYKKPVKENFADGKGPGRPGDSVRHGIPKGATMAELEKASHAGGRKGELARWQLNMRRGKKK